MNKTTMYEQITNQLKEKIQMNFEVLADEITDILVDLEARHTIDAKSGLAPQIIDSLATKFDIILRKRLTNILWGCTEAQDYSNLKKHSTYFTVNLQG